MSEREVEERVNRGDGMEGGNEIRRERKRMRK